MQMMSLLFECLFT